MEVVDLQKLEPYTSIHISIMDISGKPFFGAALLVPENQQVNIIPMAVRADRNAMFLISLDGIVIYCIVIAVLVNINAILRP